MEDRINTANHEIKQGKNKKSYEWEMRWLYEALERRVKRGYSQGNEAETASKILDECLKLPHGPREDRFILGVIDNMRKTKQLKHAA